MHTPADNVVLWSKLERGCYLYSNEGRGVLNACNLMMEKDQGPVPLSRVIKPPARQRREQTTFLPVDEAEPPLSPLEADFLKENHGGTVPNPLPWFEGRELFMPNPDNMFNMLEKQVGQHFFAGPSGSAADVLQTISLFEGTNYLTKKWYAALAGIIVWLTGARHHSVDEVMLAAETYGVKYDMRADPDEMLLSVMAKMQ